MAPREFVAVLGGSASIPLVRRVLPRHPQAIRVGMLRRGIPLLASLAPCRACREPDAPLSLISALATSSRLLTELFFYLGEERRVVR